MNKISNKYLIGQRFLFDPYDNSLIDQSENDELTRLGSNESRALSLLIEDPGAIITRTRLHDYVWREQGFEVDDSSLTQAISTLRKALKDSTKSPEFIKTVPKRGYQMIANVNEMADSPAVAEAPLVHADAEAVTSVTGMDTLAQQSAIAEPNATPSNKNNDTVENNKPSKIAILKVVAVMIACFLPLLVNLSFPPKSEAFKPLLTVNGVQVLTPKNHPDLMQWKTLISSCVETYLEYHQGDERPLEVIATGGQSNQLWLNYIHGTSVPGENVTLRLLTSHEDNTKLCQ
ncbi:winged helix-turn-helix domain-containing protein [Photobacterium alginatilyticum]|uniref:Transcriptional regulator n=1 Tax=Photobacterium alginatilyticum TaxID=1775171 RepID=A0ABW9YGE2_9GAMM|nr:transcriptional regulator [Photobacterium alginatilyticum]NBI52867.1 transcriptional regulator [Photobacterium alginatilyticum]